jgi:ribosomal protein L27
MPWLYHGVRKEIAYDAQTLQKNFEIWRWHRCLWISSHGYKDFRGPSHGMRVGVEWHGGNTIHEGEFVALVGGNTIHEGEFVATGANKSLSALVWSTFSPRFPSFSPACMLSPISTEFRSLLLRVFSISRCKDVKSRFKDLLPSIHQCTNNYLTKTTNKINKEKKLQMGDKIIQGTI